MKKILIIFFFIFAMNMFAAPLYKDAAAFIAKNEGFSGTVYKCSAGRLTIGYGFTDSHLVSKKTLSENMAKMILEYKAAKLLFQINKNPKWQGLSDNQKIVLADMMYHFGAASIKNAKALNSAIASRDAKKVSVQLMRWNKCRVNGKIKTLKGLTNRQKKLVDLWNQK